MCPDTYRAGRSSAAHIASITCAMSWHTPRRSCHASAAVVRIDVTSCEYSKAFRMQLDIAVTVSRTRVPKGGRRVAQRLVGLGEGSGRWRPGDAVDAVAEFSTEDCVHAEFDTLVNDRYVHADHRVVEAVGMPARASDLCVFDTDGVGDPLLVVVEMLGDDDEPLTQRSDRSRVRVCDVLMEDVRRAACRKERRRGRNRWTRLRALRHG